MAVRLEPTKGAVHRGAVHPRVGDRELLSLADDLVAVGFAQLGECEEHDRLAEAIQVPHLAGAWRTVRMSSVAAAPLISHMRYL